MTSQALVRMEPRTPQEAASMLADAAAAGSRIALSGGETHTPPDAGATDGVLSTLGLREIVEYAAEDQTVTVEAGITLADLSAVLAAQGQRLVLDLAEPERSTLGGAIAANAFGPRRTRYGSLKDLILGVTLVRADGTVARAGGKVVKNVAGFDLSKLVVGSYGTLALVTTATLRVHPLPEKMRAVRSTGLAASAIWDAVLAIRKRQLEPAALVAIRTGAGSGYTLDVLFEGFAAGVDAQIDALAALAPGSERTADEIDWNVASAADRDVRRGGSLRVRCTFRPSDLAEIDRSIFAPLASVLDRAAVAVYPALGVAFVAGEAHDAGSALDALVAAREDIERRGGSLIIEALPEAANAGLRIDTWGTPPPSFALMRELKARFDPQGRLNPGCFVGGL